MVGPVDPEGNPQVPDEPVGEEDVRSERVPGPGAPAHVPGGVADPWHFGVDPDPELGPRIHASDWLMDPDPAIFIIDLQDAN